MTPTEFREALGRLGLSQTGLARMLSDDLGDPSEPSTVLRRVQRWATGDHKVPGEMIGLLTLMERTMTRGLPIDLRYTVEPSHTEKGVAYLWDAKAYRRDGEFVDAAAAPTPTQALAELAKALHRAAGT